MKDRTCNPMGKKLLEVMMKKDTILYIADKVNHCFFLQSDVYVK